ncbi:S8 family peptidase [Haloferula rosea]|uniref:S8 family serine peptidase n=1 Tax=Haloferula rosea TaxID=490093 RepID=A0A934R6F3_9BACT|nr:S8 family serine peptidase [Haloferula rosea]MBK1826169.1 S8 family serine peptidase [Haloferula rosea]
MLIRFLRFFTACAGILPLAGKEPIPITPHASQEATDWVLSALNDADTAAPELSYVFPETPHKVRLYLIDTAVDNASGWFDTNNILTLEDSQLIRGQGDPTSSSAFTHGTQVLSVIAGPEAGVARGTEIEVVSFDIYPDGEETSSTVGLLVTALGEAINHFIDNPGTPSVVCIANGSSEPASSTFLEARISEAVGRGMTVVVAAGNEGSDASAYIPAAYGTMDGVICVGASDQGHAPLASSNSGDAVDVHAPGVNVQTFHPESHSVGQTTPMTGTSPATAIVAATALAELGRQPGLNPSEVENLLKARAYTSDSESKVRVVQLDNDFDSDGTPDELERFFGYDPLNSSSTPPAIAVRRANGFTMLDFTISEDLLNTSGTSTLRDGSSWRLLCSTNLKDWMEVERYVHIGQKQEGRVAITILDDAVLTEDAPVPVSGGPVDSLRFDLLTGEPIVEYEEAESTANIQVQPRPRVGVRCFYKLEWIPARLAAE